MKMGARMRQLDRLMNRPVRLFALLIVGLCLSLPSAAQFRGTPGEGEIRVNSILMSTLQEAFDTVRDGGIILMGPGTFRMSATLRTNNVTILGTKDTWLDGVAADGKGAITIKSDNVVIDTVNCRNISVRSRNGACIRHEGGKLLVKNVHFKDSEQGILSWHKSESVIVEDSILENLGATGRSHGLYIDGKRLEVRRTKIIGSKDQGHGIKSRCETTIIERNLIASGDGDDSRLIDISSGGFAVIRDNVLVEGVNTVNWNIVAYGLEQRKHNTSHIVLERNVIISDRPGGAIFLHLGNYVERSDVRDNIFIGEMRFMEKNDTWPDGNFFYATREDFGGLPPSPALPEVTLR